MPVKKFLKTVAIVTVVLIAAGIILSDGEKADGRVITEQEFGEAWPFTVAEGRLRCIADAVTFEVNGRTYAVNGRAKSQGFAQVEPIWKFNWEMYKSLAEAQGITAEQAKERAGPIRISIGPIISAGLVLCD